MSTPKKVARKAVTTKTAVTTSVHMNEDYDNSSSRVTLLNQINQPVLTFDIEQLVNCCGVLELGFFDIDHPVKDYANFNETLTKQIKVVVESHTRPALRGVVKAKTVMTILNGKGASLVVRQPLIDTGMFILVKTWVSTSGSTLEMFVSNN